MSQKPVNKPTAVPFLNQETEQLPELSQRQQQILALIKAGKVNKEIANELGIGLGTVKQHVVALFKKLHVSNRTMAVSQGFNQTPAPQPGDTEISEGMLERRPCIVLSLFLTEPHLQDRSATSLRAISEELHKTFSELANAHDALFLTSKNHLGDLIFGFKGGTEQDVYKALSAARAVYDALIDYPELRQHLKGGLAAGLAISSIKRYGGWSGEVVASAVISYARELASNAAYGELMLAASTKKLLEITGPNGFEFTVSSLLFKTLNRMPWDEKPPLSQATILGRVPELERLNSLFSEVFKSKKNHLVYIEGETGMGKSMFCRYAAEYGLVMKGRVQHFVCHYGGNLYMYPSGASAKAQTLLHCLSSITGRSQDVIIVDDAHLLPPNILVKATEAASAANKKLILFAARKFSKFAKNPSETIKLGHLSKTAIENLILNTLAQETTHHDQQHIIETIVQHAAGVPLFAIELAHSHQEDNLPLSLQIVINERMDGLKLDRALLRQVSKAPSPLTVAEIAEAMWEAEDSIQLATEQAIASGVLCLDENGCLRFVHPLLRMLINQSEVE